MWLSVKDWDKKLKEDSLLASSEENRELLLKKDKCDRYDYIAAVAFGAIGGMIDIFLVGVPGDSVLGKWTDKQANNAVMAFARKLGWNPKSKNIDNVNSAVGFLERKFKVNYDQRKPGDVNDLFKIASNTHHAMSLAHSPDIVGLFFSILNQFTSTSSFIADGQLVTISTDTFELQGGNFQMRIMCGIANWFGHLMSDVSGSSGSHNRGTGIVMPFYEFFGMCDFGSFSTKEGKKSLAEIARQAFTQGYDFRFGIAQAIPVFVTEMGIRFVWALKQHFYHHKPIRECIPTMKNGDLRVMLIVGHGTLCVMDGIDAGLRSGGDFLMFFMRLNLFAWFRFASLVLKEVCIRVGLEYELYADISAYKRINEALSSYLHELEKIDTEQFRIETAKYKNTALMLRSVRTQEELNVKLLEIFDRAEIDKSWQGDFDKHMSNRNATLIFK